LCSVLAIYGLNRINRFQTSRYFLTPPPAFYGPEFIREGNKGIYSLKLIMQNFASDGYFAKRTNRSCFIFYISMNRKVKKNSVRIFTILINYHFQRCVFQVPTEKIIKWNWEKIEKICVDENKKLIMINALFQGIEIAKYKNVHLLMLCMISHMALPVCDFHLQIQTFDSSSTYPKRDFRRYDFNL
jgi:hypothetical protein